MRGLADDSEPLGWLGLFAAWLVAAAGFTLGVLLYVFALGAVLKGIGWAWGD